MGVHEKDWFFLNETVVLSDLFCVPRLEELISEGQSRDTPGEALFAQELV